MPDASATKHSGQCLCGGVKFSINVPDAHFHACHCGMCRRWSGGPWMAVNCPGVPEYEGEPSLAWYQGSEWAERGFCTKCGSALFYRLAKHPDMLTAVSVESFDDAEGMELAMHIFIDSKPDRYDFHDGIKRLTGAEFQELVGGG